MKKVLALFLSFVLTVTVFSGCKAKEPINIIIMDDLNSATFVNLIDKTKNGTAENEYTFTTVYSAQAVTAKITKGEADVAVVPAFVAASLYNKTDGGMTLLALTTSGSISLVTKGEEITKYEDLKGKEIFVSGRGTDTEYMLKYLLLKNGVTPDTVKVTSVADDSKLIEKFKNGDAKISVVSEPTKTLLINNVPDTRTVMGITADWNSATNNSGIIQGAIVVREDFLKKNKGKVKKFLKEAETSVYMASADTATTAKLCVTEGIFESEEIAKSVLKNSEISFVTGNDMKTRFRKSIKALHTVGMKVMGTKAPGDKFYYNVK